MAIEPFSIRITSVGEAGYEVHVRSPAGEATAPCDLSGVAWWLQEAAKVIPADPEDWRATGFDRALDELYKVREQHPSWDPKKIGGALYHAVFSQRIKSLFDQSLGQARSEAGGLAIELRFQPESPHQARLASLPWELLYDPQEDRFLAQSEETPITRYLAFEGRVRRYQAPAVWRLLVVASAPSDLLNLDMDRELEILEGLPQANIVVDRLERPTRRRLRNALRRGYHVLHFLGHGDFDKESGGSIALLDERGEADSVAGQELAQWVRNSRSLRLVVLNACRTGEDKGPQPFAGVASALVREGVPAALAMRRPIPDGRAYDFAKVLYGRLSAGTPLDAALSSARQELAILEPERSHWAAPTLYSHTHDVFHVPANLRETLTTIFSWLGVVTANIALNTYGRAQGWPQLPGFQFYEVSKQSAWIFGIAFVAPLLICLLLVILRYQRDSPQTGLFHRLPIAFGVPIGDRRKLANLYQTIMLIALVAVPVISQIYFQERILIHGEVREKYATKPIWAEGPLQQLTKTVPLTVFLTDDYYFGPPKEPGAGYDPAAERPSVVKNSKCRKEGLKVCDVTYFPFWQPWLFLLTDLYIFVLFAAVLWGIWAREPLFQKLGRLAGRLRPSYLIARRPRAGLPVQTK